MKDSDRDLLYLLAIVVFFPWSVVFLIGRWMIRRAKAQRWS